MRLKARLTDRIDEINENIERVERELIEKLNSKRRCIDSVCVHFMSWYRLGIEEQTLKMILDMIKKEEVI